MPLRSHGRGRICSEGYSNGSGGSTSKVEPQANRDGKSAALFSRQQQQKFVEHRAVYSVERRVHAGLCAQHKPTA
jgi:hypothetical protein